MKKKFWWLVVLDLPFLLMSQQAARRIATLCVYLAIGGIIWCVAADNIAIGRVDQVTHLAEESVLLLNANAKDDGEGKNNLMALARIPRDPDISVGDVLLIQAERKLVFGDIPAFEGAVQYTCVPQYGRMLDGFKQTLGIDKLFTAKHLTAVLAATCVFLLIMPELTLVATMGTMALIFSGAAFIIHYIGAWVWGLWEPHRAMLLSFIIPLTALWGATLAARAFWGGRENPFERHEGFVLWFWFRRLSAMLASIVLLRLLGADAAVLAIPAGSGGMAGMALLLLLFLSPYAYLTALAFSIPHVLGAWPLDEAWTRQDLIALVAMVVFLLISYYVHRPSKHAPLGEGRRRRPYFGLRGLLAT